MLRAWVRKAPEARAAACWRMAGWALKSKSSMGLAAREPGGADPQLGAGGVAGRDFPFEHGGEVVLVGPAGVAGLLSQPLGGFGDAGCFERGGKVMQLPGRVAGWRGHAFCPPLLIRPNARS
jgi:hypothetical protein